MPNPLPAIGRTLGNVGKFGGEWLMNMADPQRQQFQRQMQWQRQRDFLDQQNWLARQSVLHKSAMTVLGAEQNAPMSEYQKGMLGLKQESVDIDKTRLMGDMTGDMIKALGYGRQGMTPFQHATQQRWGEQDTRQTKIDEQNAVYKQLEAAIARRDSHQPTSKFNPYANAGAGGWVEGPSQVQASPEQVWGAQQNVNRLNASVQGQQYQVQPYVSPTDSVIALLQNPAELEYVREKLSTEEGREQLKANGIDVGRLTLEMGKHPAPAPPPLPERRPRTPLWRTALKGLTGGF